MQWYMKLHKGIGMQVSIVIPNYKGEAYLVPCIRSILEADADGISMCIRIIDNASDDGALAALEAFLVERQYLKADAMTAASKAQMQKHMAKAERIWKKEQAERVLFLPIDMRLPRVEVTRLPENTGFCHAVNVGIRLSSEEYIFLLNNDTTIEPACISALCRCMETHPNAFSVSAKMLVMADPTLADDCGDSFSALGYARGRGKGKKETLYQEEETVFAACGGAAMYRRKWLSPSMVGLFDENHFAYLEDMDLGYRARIYGYENYFSPEARVLHAGSAVSGSKHNAFKQRLAGQNNIYLLYKNMPMGQLLLNVPFLAAGFMIKILYFTMKGLGGAYLSGMRAGFGLCMSPKGRKHKVRFRLKHLRNYVKIQLLLWRNLVEQ